MVTNVTSPPRSSRPTVEHRSEIRKYRSRADAFAGRWVAAVMACARASSMSSPEVVVGVGLVEVDGRLRDVRVELAQHAVHRERAGRVHPPVRGERVLGLVDG